jgi:hypothetical protein
MPIDESEVEITKEEPEILQRMKPHKFYSLLELYELLYSSSFDSEVKLYTKTDTSWVPIVHQARLTTILEILVALGKLRTGTIPEPRKKVKVKSGTLESLPSIYYALT